jgi:DNA adenine methylase
MKPIIKWPGGKSGELDKLEGLIPPYARYVEPFFGGGALFFHLAPKTAAVNDVSGSLIRFYRLIQAQDPELRDLLLCFHRCFQTLISLCTDRSPELERIFWDLLDGSLGAEGLPAAIDPQIRGLSERIVSDFGARLLLEQPELERFLRRAAEDKFLRTAANHRRKPFPPEDLRENLITGFAAGFYLYVRKVHNELRLGRRADRSLPFQAAVFYFIREYCYGSMFRYNAKGEFNIPYGGMSYNRKDLGAKIEAMFSEETRRLFSNTALHCSDFEPFLEGLRLTGDDFLFLDPPYDTDFSDYEGRAFTQRDQERLAGILKQTPARFLLVIKNTDFILGLYEQDFRILSFDKRYACNVKSRNDRAAEHLIITNLSV